MKIMVLPGTIWQVPLMKKIKSMGHELYLTNPQKNEGVYEIADHFLEADIFAYDTIISYCKKEMIDVVMSEECDVATDAVAKINKEIGANCISAEMAELFTNKYKMREFCSARNINPIPHKLCKTIDDAYAFYRENGPKAIMKPIDSNASHGVFTINSEDDIIKGFDETLSFSRNTKAVLLEKYIEGTEFTVDGIMTQKGHITLAISEKDHYKHNDNIANSLFFTQQNPKFDYTLLRNTNDALLNATGLPFGLTHVEYKFMDGTFYLIEMAARGGGNLISAIIAPFMGGVDNYDYLIHRTLDENYDSNISVDIDNDRTAILKFLDLPCEGGIVKAIHGEDYLRRESRIKSYRLNFSVGDFIHQPECDSVRIGYYIICAETRAEFDEVTENISVRFGIDIEDP
ncbi:MAG: ATP-grasp domain-containing protein [Faecousia sp.]